MGIIFLTPWSWMTTLPKRTCKKGARGIVSNLDEGRRDGGGGQATLMQPLRLIIITSRCPGVFWAHMLSGILWGSTEKPSFSYSSRID